MSCAITWAWSFLTSEVVEADRGQISYFSAHFGTLTQRSVHHLVPVLLTKYLPRNEISYDSQPPFSGLISSISYSYFSFIFSKPFFSDLPQIESHTMGHTISKKCVSVTQKDIPSRTNMLSLSPRGSHPPMLISYPTYEDLSWWIIQMTYSIVIDDISEREARLDSASAALTFNLMLFQLRFL